MACSVLGVMLSESSNLRINERRGEIEPTPHAASAAGTVAKHPSGASFPTMGPASVADQARGDAHGDGAAAGAGPACDARLRDARERADRYLAELIEEVGEPSPQEVAEAEAWATRIERALKEARAAP